MIATSEQLLVFCSKLRSLGFGQILPPPHLPRSGNCLYGAFRCQVVVKMFGLPFAWHDLAASLIGRCQGNLADQTNRGELAIWCARHRATTLYSVGYLVGPGP